MSKKSISARKSPGTPQRYRVFAGAIQKVNGHIPCAFNPTLFYKFGLDDQAVQFHVHIVTSDFRCLARRCGFPGARVAVSIEKPLLPRFAELFSPLRLEPIEAVTGLGFDDVQTDKEKGLEKTIYLLHFKFERERHLVRFNSVIDE